MPATKPIRKSKFKPGDTVVAKHPMYDMAAGTPGKVIQTHLKAIYVDWGAKSLLWVLPSSIKHAPRTPIEQLEELSRLLAQWSANAKKHSLGYHDLGNTQTAAYYSAQELAYLNAKQALDNVIATLKK
jgi:hypothetical protein